MMIIFVVFCLLLKLSTNVWRNWLLNFFIQTLQLFKFYLILFMLESVHYLCEAHDLSFYLDFHIISVILWSRNGLVSKSGSQKNSKSQNSIEHSQCLRGSYQLTCLQKDRNCDGIRSFIISASILCLRSQRGRWVAKTEELQPSV